jgi:hypothetical protein
VRPVQRCCWRQGSAPVTPDPLVAGLTEPEVRTSATVLRLLWPGIEQWLLELRRSSANHHAKILEPWVRASMRVLAADGFADEPLGPAPRRGGSPSGHDELTTAEAAEALCCTPQHAARLCRLGRLDGRQVGRQWLVTRRSIDDYRAAA